jgi:hypothetical protein
MMSLQQRAKKWVTTTLLTGGLFLSGAAQAGLIVDENDYIDFSADTPVLFTLEAGNNTFEGKASHFDGRLIDLDSFMFEILEGYTLRSILFSTFSEAPPGSEFVAVHQIVKASKAGLSEEVISESKSDILYSDNQPLFIAGLPLGKGLYGFHTDDVIKNFEGRAWSYTVSFDVVKDGAPAPVNAPSALALMLLGLGLMRVYRRS